VTKKDITIDCPVPCGTAAHHRYLAASEHCKARRRGAARRHDRAGSPKATVIINLFGENWRDAFKDDEAP
jgi:hypothetical protein